MAYKNKRKREREAAKQQAFAERISLIQCMKRYKIY